jgi:hypothetical protein
MSELPLNRHPVEIAIAGGKPFTATLVTESQPDDYYAGKVAEIDDIPGDVELSDETAEKIIDAINVNGGRKYSVLGGQVRVGP